MGERAGHAPRRRGLAALLLLAVALAAAGYLGSYRSSRTLDETGLTSYGSVFVPPPSVEVPYRPGWVLPAAGLISTLGVAGAVGLLRLEWGRRTHVILGDGEKKEASSPRLHLDILLEGAGGRAGVPGPGARPGRDRVPAHLTQGQSLFRAAGEGSRGWCEVRSARIRWSPGSSARPGSSSLGRRARASSVVAAAVNAFYCL